MFSVRKESGAQASCRWEVWEIIRYIVLGLLGILVFANPFPHITSVKEVSYYLSLFLFLVLLGKGKVQFRPRTPFLVVGGLFFLWASVGAFFAVDQVNTIHDILFHLVRYVVIFYLLLTLYNTPKRVNLLLWITIFSTAAFLAWSIWYYYSYLGHAFTDRLGTAETWSKLDLLDQTPIGVIAYISLFGTACCLFAMQERFSFLLKGAALGLLPLMMVPLYLSQERSGILALVVVLLLAIRNLKVKGILLVLAVLFTLLSPVGKRFSVASLSGNLRIPMGYLSMEVIKDYPVTGIGYGMETFAKDLNLEEYRERVGSSYNSVPIEDPHNILFDIAIRTGLVGLALFGGICMTFLSVCLRTIGSSEDLYAANMGRLALASGAGIFTASLFQPLFSHIPEFLICLAFYLATMAWRLKESSEGIGSAL